MSHTVAKKRKCTSCKQSRFLRQFAGGRRWSVCLICRRFAADRQLLEKKAAALVRRVTMARKRRDAAIALEHDTMKLLDAVNRNLAWNRYLHDQQKHPSIRPRTLTMPQAA